MFSARVRKTQSVLLLKLGQLGLELLIGIRNVEEFHRPLYICNTLQITLYIHI